MNYYFKCEYINESKIIEEQGIWDPIYIFHILPMMLNHNCNVYLCINGYWFNIEHLRDVLK